MPRRTVKKVDLEVVDLESNTDEFVKIFVYGAPKTGKTIFGASASVCKLAAPVLMCDVEAGAISIRKAPTSLVNKKTLRLVRITQFEQFNRVYQIVSDNPGRFKTVVIDSISEVHAMTMTEIMHEVVLKDPTREEFVPSRREWGIARARLRKLVAEFRDLPVNLVIVGMLRLDEDQGTGAILKSPQLPGQLRMEIPGYCDVVGLMEIVNLPRKKGERKEVKRVLHLQQVSNAVVGSRSWGIPDSVRDPTFEKIRTILLGG